MIIISILLVPFLVLILLSVVFVIGVSGFTSPRYDNRSDKSLNQ